MKKVLLSSAIFLASVAGAFAQTAAGNIAIGGTLDFTSTSGKNKTTTNGTTVEKDGDKTTSFTILPNVSYFISDKFAIGLGIGYTGNSTTSPSNAGNYNLKTTSSSFGVNPFAKYFISVGDKSAFFIKGGLDLEFGKTKSQKDNSTNTGAEDGDPGKLTTIGFGITPGFLFFPANNWGVELGLGNNLIGYKTTTIKTTGTGYELKNTTNTLELLGINTLTPGVTVSVFYFIK